MTPDQDIIEKVARAMAGYFGPEFDSLHKDKREWINTRGEKNGHYQDGNQPRQDDLLEVAEAIIPLITKQAEEALLKEMMRYGHFTSRQCQTIQYFAEQTRGLKLELRAREHGLKVEG